MSLAFLLLKFSEFDIEDFFTSFMTLPYDKP